MRQRWCCGDRWFVMNRWFVSLKQQSGIVGKDGFFVAARSAQPFCQFALRYCIMRQRTLRLLVLVDSRFWAAADR